MLWRHSLFCCTGVLLSSLHYFTWCIALFPVDVFAPGCSELWNSALCCPAFDSVASFCNEFSCSASCHWFQITPISLSRRCATGHCPWSHPLCALCLPCLIIDSPSLTLASWFVQRQSALQLCTSFSIPRNHCEITSRHHRYTCTSIDTHEAITRHGQDYNLFHSQPHRKT